MRVKIQSGNFSYVAGCCKEGEYIPVDERGIPSPPIKLVYWKATHKFDTDGLTFFITEPMKNTKGSIIRYVGCPRLGGYIIQVSASLSNREIVDAAISRLNEHWGTYLYYIENRGYDARTYPFTLLW